VQLLEAIFHFAAAITLLVATKRCSFPGRRLAAYLTLYAVVRFALEFARVNPVVALGFTYHQFLAIGLGVIAGITFVRRTPRRQSVA
jgi:prolipoprotein diacylglyceryltransferase